MLSRERVDVSSGLQVVAERYRRERWLSTRIKKDDAGARERRTFADYRYRRYAFRYWQLGCFECHTRERRYMILGYYGYSFGTGIRDLGRGEIKWRRRGSQTTWIKRRRRRRKEKNKKERDPAGCCRADII